MKHYKPFRFKQFSIDQNNAAMKVGTDSVLLGAWATIYPNEIALDIGTGTGLLSLMLAQKVDGQCSIDAIEIDEGSIKDARININDSNWEKSIELQKIDLVNFHPDKHYDLIISNPPFFEGLAPDTKSRSIARNASDKLSYQNLVKTASNLLNNGGRFYLIIPQENYEKVIALSNENNLILMSQVNIKPKIDKPVNRFLLELVKSESSKRRKNSIEVVELVVRNNRNIYTKEHQLLTKDYYM
jgi:tRNA1Val (adenine37-N6)-methyltransferase